ncbi:hypothetical protein GC163_13355 [bacterium]|nr:hypothetical protein [bacterium]
MSSAHPHTALTAATRLDRWFWPIVLVLLLIPAGLAVDCARRWTPTHDEFWHMPLGLRYLQTNDYSVDPINPPLPRMLAALPLALGQVDAGSTLGHVAFGMLESNEYDYADAFLNAHPHDIRRYYFYGRLMLIPLGILGGALVAGLSRGWYGTPSGLLAALLWACCPTLLANSAIVAHDLPVTVAVFGAFCATLWLIKHPVWWRALLLGMIIGAALVTKFSALPLLLLLPVVAATLLPYDRGLDWKRLIGYATLVGFGLLIAIHLAFAMDQYANRSLIFSLLYNNLTLANWDIRRWRMLVLPIEFLRGWSQLRHAVTATHPVYLDGEWTDQGGYRDYYLRALAYKLPLGTLACLLCGLLSIFAQRKERQELKRAALLLMFVLAYIVPASLAGNQLGIRYILPAFPFLIVLASSSARWIDWEKMPRRTVVILLAAASLPFSLRYHPHHLAYFNEYAGGPANGWQHLVDSNVDWGQDLHALKDWLDEHPGEPIKLAYFGTVSPSAVGFGNDYHLPPTRYPSPGRYAVSVNYVAGRPHRLRDVDGLDITANIDDFGYFRFFEPDARIGYSIFVYDLSPEDIARYRAAVAAALSGQ